MNPWLILWGLELCALGVLALVVLSKREPHTHDEGDHDPRCPGCFAEKVKR